MVSRLIISVGIGQTLSDDILSLVDMVIDYLWHQLILDEIYQHHLVIASQCIASQRIVSIHVPSFSFAC